MTDTNFVGVQFKPIGRTYTFSLPEGLEVERGSNVVVNTARGRQVGRVTALNVAQPETGTEVLAIERAATAEDLQTKTENKLKEEEVVAAVAKYLQDPGHDGVKVVEAEYSLDLSKLIIYLNYETGIDFNPRVFIRDISNIFRDCRIEVRQVGPRDAAKALSGIGSCGIERRCCSRFLTDFSSISIKMAKSQDVSLTPMEITGICGRLRCCLAYEHEMYEEARSRLPKKKKVVNTPLGEGKVLQVMPLKDSVLVELPEKGPREFTRTELETGVLEEKTAQTAESNMGYFLHEEDVEVIKLGAPKSREDRSKARPDRRTERASIAGEAAKNSARNDERTGHNRKTSSEKRHPYDSGTDTHKKPQGNAKPRGEAGQAPVERKGGSNQRRRSRPYRGKGNEKPPKEN